MLESHFLSPKHAGKVRFQCMRACSAAGGSCIEGGRQWWRECPEIGVPGMLVPGLVGKHGGCFAVEVRIWRVLGSVEGA